MKLKYVGGMLLTLIIVIGVWIFKSSLMFGFGGLALSLCVWGLNIASYIEFWIPRSI